MANLLGIYITRWGFFRPFTLDSAGLFIEIAAHNRTPHHELAAFSERVPPDHLAERHHRHLRGDPDRRRGVRRGVRRRLGAGDPVRSRRHRRAHSAGGAVRGRRLRDGGVHPRRPARRAVHEARVRPLTNRQVLRCLLQMLTLR